MPSGAQNRAARSSRERREEEARDQIPLRLANLLPAERGEAADILTALFEGRIGDPDA